MPTAPDSPELLRKIRKIYHSGHASDFSGKYNFSEKNSFHAHTLLLNNVSIFSPDFTNFFIRALRFHPCGKNLSTLPARDVMLPGLDP